LGIVTGYFADFNTEDSDKDIIMPGAFTKTILENGPTSNQPRIKHLLNHNTGQPLGKLTVLKEDIKGLAYESKVGDHNLGIDFMKMVDCGLITEHSIGYGVVRKTIMNADADWRDQVTQLQELKLWEGSSLTAWGANMNTPLTGVKMQKYCVDRIPALIKAIKSGTFTDATFEILEKELLYLQSAFNSISGETTPPEPAKATTAPNEEKGLSEQIALLNLKLALFN
jgi:HK97 family phage prohead protease